MKKLLLSVFFSALFLSIFANEKKPLKQNQNKSNIDIKIKKEADPCIASSTSYTYAHCPGKRDILKARTVTILLYNCVTGATLPGGSTTTEYTNKTCADALPLETEISEIGD